MNRVTCRMCHREVPVRKDGRLQAHLAEYGKRAKCDGSGMYYVHVMDMDREAWDGMTPAERFNARDEWAKVYALQAEYRSMRHGHGASYEAELAAWEALQRALSDARAMVPWYLVHGHDLAA